ncbi:MULTISPECIES: PLAT/LH2 domain-containing protein [unclassified Streptomyces]|nr:MULTISPECIES: PLAT/LH2 domain-containing protein [unclassified Streptomyces]WUC68303.1 PLAT/LH2 domain-containing protein [Streptomyces sp. NBC_00539]
MVLAGAMPVAAAPNYKTAHLTIATLNDGNAGTDREVQVRFWCQPNSGISSDWRTLDKTGYDDFERGATDEYTVDNIAENCTSLTTVEMRLAGGGPDDWHVDWIEATGPGGTLYETKSEPAHPWVQTGVGSVGFRAQPWRTACTVNGRLVTGTMIEGTSGNDVIDCPKGVKGDTTVNGLGGDDRIASPVGTAWTARLSANRARTGRPATREPSTAARATTPSPYPEAAVAAGPRARTVVPRADCGVATAVPEPPATPEPSTAA